MDLYQASLARDSNQFESNSNALEKENAEVNNALMMHNFGDSINTKGLRDFDFLRSQIITMFLAVHNLEEIAMI